MAKSAEAFRTISEVADWLGSPAHVLRFWESKFSQVKPVKRAGGRRYYRPADMLLLGGIKKLLHDDGMTIKGVQKILREQGVKHISDLSPPLEDEAADAGAIEGHATEVAQPETAAADSAQVLQFQREETDREPASEHRAAPDDVPAEAGIRPAASEPREPAATPKAANVTGDTASPVDARRDDAAEPAVPEPAAAKHAAPPEAEQSAETTASEPAREPESAPAEAPDTPAAADENRLTDIPAFLHRTAPAAKPASEEDEVKAVEKTGDSSESEAARAKSESETPPPPRPAIIKLPPDPADDAVDAPPGLLAALAARRGRPLPPGVRAAAIAQRDKLSALLSRQSSPRRD